MAKSRTSSRTQSPRRPSLRVRLAGLTPDWWIVGLASAGMIITGYLTGVAVTGTEAAFCGSGSGCEIVRQSRWSTVLGIPIALLGFGVYTLIALTAGLMRPRLPRWKRLWYISLLGLAVSVYLTIVGIVTLDAVCIWCLASLATMTAIFISVCLRRPSSAPGVPWRTWATQSSIAALVFIVLLHGYYSGIFQPAENPKLKALAVHLDKTDARFYGAFWCPHCQDQKELFGPSADRLPYIECTPNGRNGVRASVCLIENIDAYPTWVINGRRYTRVLQPKTLAQYSNFDWNKDYSRKNE